MSENRRMENQLIEAHFCGLQSQSNVYGLCKIDLPNKPNEILVSSLMGQVVSLKFAKNKPLSKEVRFTYIPGDAEIISIDAFNRLYHGNNVVIGISFVKVLNGKPSYYLNVYSEWDQCADFNLDSIAQGWHNIELNFTPYQLTHTELVRDGNVEMVFLLGGSDQRVHIFPQENSSGTDVSELYFPEFSDLPSNVTWLHCEYYQDYQRRITAIGLLHGVVKLSLINTQNLTVISNWTIEHDSPVTSLRLFTIKSDVECPLFVTEVVDSLEDPMENSPPEYNLLVNSAVEVSVVYRNVLINGLTNPVILCDSDLYDCVLCGYVADVDLDGQNEVLIGTYGQEVLAYKYVPGQDDKSTSRDTFEKEGKLTAIDSSQTLIETSPKCPLSEVSSRTFSLDLSERSNDTPQQTTSVQSPLNFHSGHFNTDLFPLVNSDTKGEKTINERKSVSNEKVNIVLDNKCDESNTGVKASLNSTDFKDNCNKNVDTYSKIVGQNNSTGQFKLLWKQSFAEPVFAIDSLDTTGDGLEELVVLTQKGIHVLQHDIDTAAELCLQRLKQARINQGPCQDVFKQLLSENLMSSYHEDLNSESS